MLLIHPPLIKPSEAPAGIPLLVGALREHGIRCSWIDCNIEGLLHLLTHKSDKNDPFTKRSEKNISQNLNIIRDPLLYTNPARYRKAVGELNHVIENVGKRRNIILSLSNYQDHKLSPLRSEDLITSAQYCDKNIFFSYFSKRLGAALDESSPSSVGFSLNYLSQALTCFAIIGYLKKIAPELPIIMGGSLVTSWMQNPTWTNPFAHIIDHLIPGEGEEALLQYFKISCTKPYTPDFHNSPLQDYFSPGTIIPYPASRGCYWNKCSFCPETAEDNPYKAHGSDKVLTDLSELANSFSPAMLHFLDNALSPNIMNALIEDGPRIPWYSFARISPLLTRPDFCKKLAQSGCKMLKLGIESGDQTVLDAMHKGIDLKLISKALKSLRQAGIATYVYILFGTPHESEVEARKTLQLIASHKQEITYLNLAIFNLPTYSNESESLETYNFYHGDLSFYSDFTHPRNWNRKAVRKFLDREVKRDKDIAAIIRRDPPFFSSNHAPFFQ